jgi:hypothetical protein
VEEDATFGLLKDGIPPPLFLFNKHGTALSFFNQFWHLAASGNDYLI